MLVESLQYQAFNEYLRYSFQEKNLRKLVTMNSLHKIKMLKQSETAFSKAEVDNKAFRVIQHCTFNM